MYSGRSTECLLWLCVLLTLLARVWASSIQVVATGGVFGRLLPFNTSSDLEVKVECPFSNSTYPPECGNGLSRVKAYTDSLRTNSSDVIFLDIGSFFCCGETWSNDLVTEMGALNGMMNYDALALYYSDMIPSMEQYALALNSAGMQTIASNFNFSATSPLSTLSITRHDLYLPINDLRASILVLSQPSSLQLLPYPTDDITIDTRDNIEFLIDTVARAELDGADLVIGVLAFSSPDMSIFAGVPGLDIILSQFLNPTLGLPNTLQQTAPGGAAQLICRMDTRDGSICHFEFDMTEFGEIISPPLKNEHMYVYSNESDPAIDAAIAAMIAQLGQQGGEIVGSIITPITRVLSCRYIECPVGDFVTDALLAAANGTASFALLPGIRVSNGLDPGQVTYAQLTSLFPFGGLLTLVRECKSGLDWMEDLQESILGLSTYMQISGASYSLNGQTLRIIEVSWPLDSIICGVKIDFVLNITEVDLSYTSLGISGHDAMRIYIEDTSPTSVKLGGRIGVYNGTSENDDSGSNRHGKVPGWVPYLAAFGAAGVILAVCSVICVILLSVACLVCVLAVVLIIALIILAIGIVTLPLAGYFLARRRLRDTVGTPDFIFDLDLDDEVTLVSKLGGGTYGDVYLASWRSSEVAVKVFHDGYRGPECLREITLMSKLRHPNVVLLMAASLHGDVLALVMELMPLGSLYDVLHFPDLPPMPLRLVLRLSYMVACGMAYVHEMGVVHRDLKSLNVLLDEQWRAKISDFGLSSQMDNTQTKERAVRGTLPWMAPELLRGEAVTKACDVYSFGIVVWEMLTLRTPFAELEMEDILNGLRKGRLRLEIPESTPRELADLLLACWEKDTTARPTMSDVKSMLYAMMPRDDWNLMNAEVDLVELNRILRDSSSNNNSGIDVDLSVLTAEMIRTRTR